MAGLPQGGRDAVDNDIAGEFDQMAGIQLLVTGGAGSLGHYSVDSNVALCDGKFRRA